MRQSSLCHLLRAKKKIRTFTVKKNGTFAVKMYGTLLLRRLRQELEHCRKNSLTTFHHCMENVSS